MPNISSNDRLTPRVIKTDFAVFLGLLILGIIIYLPVLNKGLLSDDFLVIRRVGLDGVVFIKGFFRPLSDVTLYLSYWMGGINGIYYNAFNIFFHILGSFFLYLFCKRWQNLDVQNKDYFPILASLFFLTYPFHNESLAWGVGRGSLLAGFFAICALLVSVTSIRLLWKILLANVFYFIGLLGYESIFLLPVVILLVAWSKNSSRRNLFIWGVSFIPTIALHICLRLWASGSFFGSYAEGMFDLKPGKYLSNFLKITGRLFLPPSENSLLLTLLFFLVLGVLGMLIWRSFKRFKRHTITLLMSLLISLVIPITFSVSTKTSESDRLIYFPSIFVCLLISFTLTQAIISRKVIMLMSTCVILYYLIFLQLSNQNWRKGSKVSKEILNEISQSIVPGKKILLLNIPDEINGVFIFRNGFNESLMFSNIDTSSVKRISRLKWEDYEGLPDEIVPGNENDTVHVAPATKVFSNLSRDSFYIEVDGKLKGPFNAEKEIIFYWNKKMIKSLHFPSK